MSAGASAGAAAAAAAAERQRQQEEEEMTSYSAADLAQDWEFKILRSSTAAFKKPEVLRAILDEEAQAGWMLVEKFDNSRIRLKRPASARALDGKLEFDAYRTTVGISEARLAFAILGAVFGALILMIVFIIAIAHR
jgi:hypothetical protein